jgi:hypothetical protein
MVFGWWCSSILRRPGRKLQLACQRAFWVYGVVLRWKLLMGFIGWWQWVLGRQHLDVWQRWWRWWVVWVMGVLEQRLFPLFLVAKNLNVVLELHKSCSFSVYVLPLGFGTMNCCNSSSSTDSSSKASSSQSYTWTCIGNGVRGGD